MDHGLRSMTGFGSAQAESARHRYQIEIKSVNHRFLNIKLHLPKELTSLEPEMSREIGRFLSRGTVDVRLTAERLPGAKATLRVDEALLGQFIGEYERLKSLHGWEKPLDPNLLLSNRDLFQPEEGRTSLETEWETLRVVLEKAMEGLSTMRRREGEMLGKDLALRISALSEGAEHIAVVQREAQAERYARLKESLEKAVESLGAKGAVLEPSRLETEVVMLAERADIAEELTRLRSHLEHFRGLMRSAEPVGKRLDFLLQEINREINTIASKSANAAISQRVVSMKAQLEQIREQVQNIE